MSKFPSFEGRPLKGKTQFLPDVYPQQPHQIEDALTEQLVKDGFKYHKPVTDEYKSSRKGFLSQDLNSTWDLYYNIIIRKAQTAPIFDPKNEQAIIKRSSGNEKDWAQLNDWLSELSNASPYRRCTVHNVSKEKMLMELTSRRYPLSNALRLINKSIIFANAPLENLKKKQKLDPTTKWTEEVLKMLDRIFSGDASTIHPSKYNSMCGDWDYLFRLLLALYDNDVIEHCDVLERIISKLELIHKSCKTMNDQNGTSCCSLKDRSPLLKCDPFAALKFVLPYFERFGVRFTESELVTRHVLYWASKAFSDFVYDCTLHSFTNRSFDKPDDYVDLFQCAHHRPLLLNISSLIISLTLNCPSAAVWNNIIAENAPPYFTGSPIDSLPCPLSFLPIPPGPEAHALRICLAETDCAILERSRLAENGWCLFPSPGFTTNQNDEINATIFARVLDELDSQDFNTASEFYPLDGLFKKIFLPEILEAPRSISVLVIFLCKWAVSPSRAGLHRSIYVACLLEALRNTLRIASPSVPANSFDFQQCLLTFLDQHAPANPKVEITGFRSLVCLFGELIDRGLFNHDAFVRTFIARGVFDGNLHPLANSDNLVVSTVVAANIRGSSSNIGNFSVQSELSEENDRNSVDNPDSVRSDFGVAGSLSSPDLTRHLQYLIHFPIPQDDSYAHEQNQRAQILYGSSMRCQSRARETVKKLARDIGKLFTKSAYRVDVVYGELGKQRKKNRDSGGGVASVKESRPLEELIDVIQMRFRSLSYHDMECVISKSMHVYFRVLSGSSSSTGTSASVPMTNANDALAESLSMFADLNSTASPSSTLNSSGRDPIYYPVPSSLFFFFELIETSLNVLCLLNTAIDTIERLLQVSVDVPTTCMNTYVSLVWLRVVGILRAHHAIFITQTDFQMRVFNCIMDQFTRERMEKVQCRRVIGEYFGYLRQTSAYFNECAAYVSQNRLSEFFDIEMLPKNVDSCRLFVFQSLRVLRDLRDSEALTSFICMHIGYAIQCPEFGLVWFPAIAKATGCSGVPNALPAASPNFSGGALNSTTPPNGIQFCEDPVAWDNFTALICALLSRHCIDTNRLFKMMNIGLARGLGPNLAMPDSHSEQIARFVCHILHRFFTADAISFSAPTQSTVLPTTDGTQPSPASSFRGISDPQVLTSALERVGYTDLVDILKILMILSNKGVPSDVGEDPEDGSTIGSEENPSDDDQESDDHDSDDARGDSSLDQMDCYELTDGPPTSKSKKKRRRVHLAPQSKRRRGVGAKKNSSTTGQIKRHPVLPARLHRCTLDFLTLSQIPSDAEIQSLRLHELAQLVLREICVTPWVRICFYRQAKVLLTRNVLFDKHLSSNQTRHLLHIIYYPYDTTWVDLVAKTNSVSDAMISLISGLNIWSLHATRMELKLLRMQPMNGDSALVQVADRLVNGFNEQALASLRGSNNSGGGGGGSSVDLASVDQLPDGLPEIEIPETDSTWFVPSLAAEFPEKLQELIVNKTCDILYGMKQFWRHKNDEDQERVVMQHSILLAHPVFSSVLHVCLKTAGPLERLYEQLDCFVSSAKETRDRMPENLRTRYILQECLALRLSLLGARLPFADLNVERLTRGALILTQLIGFGVTEPHSNETLFYACLDMLHFMVHSLVAITAPDPKHYQALVKKVRKELSERYFTPGIEYIRPILFTGRTGFPFVSVAPLNGTPGSRSRGDGCGGAGGMGCGGSGKPGGPSKISSFKSSGKSGGAGAARNCSTTNSAGASFTTGGGVKAFSRKRGLVFTARDRFAPWDIYDVNRRSSFLAMCSAVQVPASLSRSEEQSTLLLSHEHPIRLRRPPEFFHKSLFHEAEHSAGSSGGGSSTTTTTTSSSSAAAVAPTVPSPSEKPFILGTVPHLRRQPSQETIPAGRRPTNQPPQQQQQNNLPSKSVDPPHQFPSYLQQQQTRLQTPPSGTLAPPTANLQPVQPPVQPTKRKRNRAQASAAQQQRPPSQPQNDSVLLQQMFPHQQQQQQQQQHFYPLQQQQQHQNSSALAAAQAVENAAAASAASVTSKRAAPNKRSAGANAGGAVGAPRGPRRGGGAPPVVHPLTYDNGVGGMVAGPWSRMSAAGGVSGVGDGGSGQHSGGRGPDRRARLPEFMRPTAQQQKAAAAAQNQNSVDEQFIQQQQQDPRFISLNRGQMDSGYALPPEMMMQSQVVGPPSAYHDFSQLELCQQRQQQQQQQQQQRYVGVGGQSRVPKPPPYPHHIPPHLPMTSSSKGVVTPVMQMLSGTPQVTPMRPPHPPVSTTPSVYYMTPHQGE